MRQEHVDSWTIGIHEEHLVPVPILSRKIEVRDGTHYSCTFFTESVWSACSNKKCVLYIPSAEKFELDRWGNKQIEGGWMITGSVVKAYTPMAAARAIRAILSKEYDRVMEVKEMSLIVKSTREEADRLHEQLSAFQKAMPSPHQARTPVWAGL